MRGKEIEEEVFYLICLCGKVKGKKKIIISNDNFTLMSLWKGISTINIESGKKLIKI